MAFKKNKKSYETKGLKNAIESSKTKSTKRMSRIASVLMAGIIMFSLSGCKEKKANSVDNYVLIDFGNSTQVVNIDNWELTGSRSSRVEVSFKDGSSSIVPVTSFWDFDEKSKEQVDLVNEILNDNNKEPFTYQYVKK